MRQQELAIDSEGKYTVLLPSKIAGRAKAITLFLALSLSAAGISLYLYLQNRQHRFAQLDLPAVGLVANLKTKWQDAAGQYVFSIKPEQGKESRFLEVLSTLPADQVHFEIHLLDSDGFELCKTDTAVHRSVDASGSPMSLHTKASFTSCSENQIRNAEHWNVTYRYPLLTANLRTDSSVQPSKPTDDSELTGVDWQTGEIESLDKGSFHVRKRAEFDTLMSWHPGDRVTIACEKSRCLVRDKNAGTAVHVVR